jgi:hypothetical protein
MCPQNAGNAISETPILKISREAFPPDPLASLCFRYSAHTFGDCILPRGGGGGQGENRPFDSFAPATTEESLKNALTQLAMRNVNLTFLFHTHPPTLET